MHAFHSCLTHITDKQESKVSKLKVKTSYRPQIYIYIYIYYIYMCVGVCVLHTTGLDRYLYELGWEPNRAVLGKQ